MAYKERTYEEILAALERLVARHSNPDEIALIIGGRTFTTREFVGAFRKKDPLIMAGFEAMLETMKRLDIDPVERIDQEGVEG